MELSSNVNKKTSFFCNEVLEPRSWRMIGKVLEASVLGAQLGLSGVEVHVAGVLHQRLSVKTEFEKKHGTRTRSPATMTCRPARMSRRTRCSTMALNAFLNKSLASFVSFGQYLRIRRVSK